MSTEAVLNNPPSFRHYFSQVLTVAAIFALRMLGIFMVIPVFSWYAMHLADATPTLVGIAAGIYGLSQALLQIPFGMLSDRFGRKKIITIGLIIFCIGSLVCAYSNSLLWLILGRFLQGCGAIGSSLIALVSDITPEAHRSKAMAVIGGAIGLSFSLAIVIGSYINHVFGVPTLFLIAAIGGILALIILHSGVSTPTQSQDHGACFNLLKPILKNKDLRLLDISIFLQHMIFTANFVVLPILIHQQLQLSGSYQWKMYLILLSLSFAIALPLIRFAENNGKIKSLCLFAICLTAISQAALWHFSASILVLNLALFIYFLSFNVLEANLPALTSRYAPETGKGTALGIYSTSQFLGIFCGGTLGGYCLAWQHSLAVFFISSLCAVAWLMVTAQLSELNLTGRIAKKVAK